MADLVSLGLTALAGPLVGGGGVWAWMAARHKARTEAPAQMMAAMAAFQEALNRQASALTAALEAKVKDLESQLGAQANRIAALEDENDTCRAENRQLRQRVDSLEALLRRQGLPIPGGATEAVVGSGAAQ